MNFFRPPCTLTTVVLACFIATGCSTDANNEADKKQTQNSATTLDKQLPKRPNILLVVADDLGYSDMGSFGGEIATPNLDDLASQGLQLTNFHVAATCSPTRSMLFSGTDNHLAGLGSMYSFMKAARPDLLGQPGYEGYLNDRVFSLPQTLKDAGYVTYMAGKWHLGLESEQSPSARGFEQSFALLQGGAGHFSDLGMVAYEPKATFRETGEIANLPEDFYSTQFYAGKISQWIGQHPQDKPFFAYLAFTAPHWPLQAPEESIERYAETYTEGYKPIYRKRLEQQKSLGLIPEDFDIDAALAQVPDWDTLTEEQQKMESRTMAIYAAMIDDLDRSMGDVIKTLKETGQYDNTVILFMSDNGAQGEGLPMFYQWAKICCDNSYDNLGKANSYIFPGNQWATVSTGISRGHKGQVTQGGIQSPAILSLPAAVTNSTQVHQFLSVMDVLPTLLDLADVDIAELQANNPNKHAIKGQSFAAILTDPNANIHSGDYVMGWELFGGEAIREGNWKMVRQRGREGSSPWQLFDLSVDPSESQNLSSQYPSRVEAMDSLWQGYVQDNGVITQ